jgi:hypothetical protein
MVSYLNIEILGWDLGWGGGFDYLDEENWRLGRFSICKGR